MSDNSRIVFSVVILISLAATPLAHGTTVQKLSFERLIGEADLIVQGRIDEVKTRQARDRSFISTIVGVSVERQFKGVEVSSITIEQPGGAVGDIVQGVPGSPQFAVGEHVILFLQRRRGDAFEIVGGKQGKFITNIQPGTDKKLVEDFAHRTEALDTFLARLTNTLKSGG
ncbi:MAG: hypothetical protein ACREQV_07580 [Candidatus Binatia bacterium]